MDNIDMNSVLKAGGIAAGIAIVLSILSLIPFIGAIFGILLICGGIFIPIAGGMMYGYFAIGEEDTQTAAIGGALAGGASGIILAVFSAILGTVTNTVSSGVGDGLAAGAVSGIGGSICFGILGFVLGAIGGAIWPMVQNNFGGRS